MKKLLNAYIGNELTICTAATKSSGVLMFVGDDYVVVEVAQDVVDIVKLDHIAALENVKYETFLAVTGRNRIAVSNDMLARAGQLAEQS